jgi:hypothetical protein
MKTGKNLLTESPGLDLGDEVLDHLVVDVGLEESPAHLAKPLLDVLFREHAPSAELPKDVVEFLGKFFEHGGTLVGVAGRCGVATTSLEEPGSIAPSCLLFKLSFHPAEWPTYFLTTD